MEELTSSQKGGLAELKIAAAAANLGIGVIRPMTEGLRYDLVFDVAGRLLRVQCKWARRKSDVVSISLRTSRHTPAGYVRTRYAADEIEGFAAYCRDLDRCFFLRSRTSSAAPMRTCVSAPRETVSFAVLRWRTRTTLGL